MPDKDVIKGNIKQAEGKLQDARGSLTGNIGDELKGKAKQVEGKIQTAVGHVKDDIRRENAKTTNAKDTTY